MRSGWMGSAVRRHAFSRPRAFSTVQHEGIGDVMTDFCFLWPEHKNANSGYIGGVVAVNNAGFTAFVGLRGRTMQDFEECVETLVKSSGFPVLSKLISDRESAVYSDTFQNHIKDTYNVTIHFLEKGNKAFRVCRLRDLVGRV